MLFSTNSFSEIINKGLRHFAEIHIACYPNYREVPVHFVGSVSYYFQDVLNDIANEMGFKVGISIKIPFRHYCNTIRIY